MPNKNCIGTYINKIIRSDVQQKVFNKKLCILQKVLTRLIYSFNLDLISNTQNNKNRTADNPNSNIENL